MKTSIDFRTAQWADIRRQVHRLRETALQHWRTHGPGTTREVANRSGMDLLTLRPRTTELLQLGFLVCTNEHGKEGIYQALSDEEAEQAFSEQKALAAECSQGELLFV